MIQITARKFKLEEQTELDEQYYAKYSLMPLDKGYAVTVGNTLRRVLLSSIPSFAITDVRFIRPEKYHEFDTIDGMKEDIMEMLLNLKKVQLRVETYVESPVKLSLVKKGPGDLTAKDIECPAGVTIVNPNHYLASLDEDADVDIELYATFERALFLQVRGSKGRKSGGSCSTVYTVPSSRSTGWSKTFVLTREQTLKSWLSKSGQKRV